MVGVIYLAMLGVAAIIGAIIGTLIGLLLSFTSLSPLIIGGTVGAIYVVLLIAAFITILLYPIPYERHSGLTLKETACLAGLFIGSVAAGVGLVACGLTPIIKVDSLSSLSTTVSSLLAMGATIPVLLIATAIGVAIVIELAKQAKEYISGKIMQAEKEPVTDTHEEPGSKMEEAKEEKTARNKQAVRECSKKHTRQVKEIKV